MRPVGAGKAGKRPRISNWLDTSLAQIGLSEPTGYLKPASKQIYLARPGRGVVGVHGLANVDDLGVL